MGDVNAHGADRTTATFALERIRQRLDLPRPVPRTERRPQSPHDVQADQIPPRAAGPAGGDRPTGRPHGLFDLHSQWFAGLVSALSTCNDLPKPVLLASIFLNLLGLALPLAMLQIYDRVLPNQATDTLLLLSIGLGVAFVLEAALKIIRAHVMGWAAVQAGFRHEFEAVKRMLEARLGDVDRSSASEWMDGFDAIGELNAFEGGNSRLILVDLPLAVIFLAMILLIAGWLVVVPLALIMAFGVLTVMKSRILLQVLKSRSEQDNRRYDFLIECLSGIHTIKSLAMESLMLRRFERLHKSSSLASYDTVLIGNKVQAIGSLFANTCQISLVTVGAVLVMNGALSIGALVCCSLLSSRLTQPVIRGLGVWSELQNVKLAEQRAARFEALDNSEFQLDEVDERKAPLIVRGAIEFKNVSYRSGAESGSGFEDISLAIGPGEFIGLRGEDDSGRSTLAALITGDLVPSTGTVAIDGHSASGPHRPSLNRHIGYAAASPVVFDGTILENITMFGPGAKLNAARRAAQCIGLEEDIHHLPEGYDTLLAQGVGESLSSGLTQRITIARALAMEPKVLIFNEANTLLDLRSDRLLLVGLERLRGSLTAVLISNRPSLLRLADRVFEVRDGRLHQIELEALDGPRRASRGADLVVA